MPAFLQKTSRYPAQQISHSLSLGFFLAAVPSVLLVALAQSSTLNLIWISPLFQTFLLSCSAALSGLIAYWLHVEAHLSLHPAVQCLAIGFACQAFLLLAGACLRQPARLDRFHLLLSAWTMVFALSSVLLMAWRRARHASRALLMQKPLSLWGLGLVVFTVFVAACLAYSAVELNDPVALTTANMRFGIACLSALGVTISFAFRLYLKRRTSMTLLFTLALFLFGLSVLARMFGPTWHLLWWYSYNLNFVSLFLVAYGIVEGNRVREGEMLIAELAALSKKLEEQSLRDPLTGCYNRRYVVEALDSEWRKARRSRLPLTLLVADADNFKSINDTWGHPFGDFVLREIGARLRPAMRTSDVLARCGGEEFYIVLPQTNRLGAQQLSNKLLTAIRSEPFQRGDISIHVTLSIGIADSLTPGVTDVASLIEAADQALYAAKHEGKDRAVALDSLTFTVSRQLPS